MRPIYPSCLVAGLVCLAISTGCAAVLRSIGGEVTHTVSSGVVIPAHVERVAVLYPKTYTKELLNGYLRLEAATFELKSRRPGLQIVDRLHLPELLSEQRLQLAGGAADDSTVRIGRMLGVDSLVIYGIEMPGVRERALARLYGDLPPVIVTTKVLKIETGEVLYYNVVTSTIPDPQGGWSGFGNERAVHPEILAALDRGLLRAVEDLRHAFVLVGRE
jgi:hypothetical protein